MWTCRAKNGVSLLGKVVKFTRSRSTQKSQYDALVIGGGGFCSEFTITANVESIHASEYTLSLQNILFRFLEIYFHVQRV